MLQRLTRTRLILAATLVMLGAGAACSDRQTISGPEAIQFSLASIDGQPLPHEVARSADGTVTTVVTDMILTITADSKWNSVGHETVTTNGVAQQQLVRGSGTFTLLDPNATFRDADGNIVWDGEVTNSDVRVQDAAGQVYYFAHAR